MKWSTPVLVACAGLAICASAAAQWTVTVLTPDAAWLSRGYGIFGHQQVGDGFLKNSTDPHAFLWEGTPESWVDLNPSGALNSTAYATDGVHQVGSALVGSVGHASLWSGTADSWVSLNPVGAHSGIVFAIGGGVQAGYVSMEDSLGVGRASLWHDTPESWTDLNPPGAWSAVANGTDGVSQVGQACFGAAYHASLWRGSAATFVDLDPSVNVGGSAALAVWGDQQVGWVSMDNEGGTNHAALWNGTAGSWVDLHPGDAGAPQYYSRAYGVYEGYQVGYVVQGQDCIMGSGPNASLWRGSAETWENLHKYLPFRSSYSIAYAVWCDETTIYVAGEADVRSDWCAVLWTRPIDSQPSTCRADIDGNGFVNGDDFDSFAGAFEDGGPLADFDHNCFVNGDDYDLFAEAFEAGC